MMGSRNHATDDPVGIIVDDPTSGESGMVAFRVQVGDGIVVGVAHPCGSGLRDDLATVDPAVASAVMTVVSRFVEEHGDEMLPLYREAARLRRGSPVPSGTTRCAEKHTARGPAEGSTLSQRRRIS
jgi:hypothetical protein